MGMYYAREAFKGQKGAEEIALAARDHYSPLGPTDTVPTEPTSVAVALADKLDTLTGFWAIDEKPTGSKDPFALRRAALGVIRLILGNGVQVGLKSAMEKWFEATIKLPVEYGAVGPSKMATKKRPTYLDRFFTVTGSGENEAGEFYEDHKVEWDEFEKMASDLLAFFHDRLKVFLKDQGIRHDVIDACLAMPGNDDLTLLVKRAEALATFLKTEDGPNLLQGFKRANTILTQAETKDGVEYSFGADIKFAETAEERALFAALDQAESTITPAMAAEDFATAMEAMAQLRAPIDAFFTAVQVNIDNEIIRRNRLNLLHRIRAICSGVADLTKLDG
jgi:glycyl-tRNA synthetase beta chain